MKKSTFEQIAQKHGLGFKEAINLVVIRSEVLRAQKYEDRDWFYLNPSVNRYQRAYIESLKEEEFIRITNKRVYLLEKGQEFSLDMGARAFLGKPEDSEILNLTVNRQQEIIQEIKELSTQVNFSEEEIENYHYEIEENAIPFEGGMTIREAILIIKLSVKEGL